MYVLSGLTATGLSEREETKQRAFATHVSNNNMSFSDQLVAQNYFTQRKNTSGCTGSSIFNLKYNQSQNGPLNGGTLGQATIRMT